MKTAVIPQIRVEAQWRADLDSALLPGETLTEFVEASVRRAVVFTPESEADLDRPFDFLLDRAETVEEAMRADEAVEAIRRAANHHLPTTPYSFRKVGQRPTWRELIVPFGSTGYVLRSDMRSPELVLVIGARHQREEDFH